MTAENIAARFSLQPLPFEGGYFRQTFRSQEWLDDPAVAGRYQRRKPLYTCIYYLVTPESFSRLHMLPSDEIYNFYLGDPVEMLLLARGQVSHQVLGNRPDEGHALQHVVPRGTWQGTRLVEGGEWALLGTTVVPGFTDDDFLVADRDRLVSEYPDHAGEIDAFCPESD